MDKLSSTRPYEEHLFEAIQPATRFQNNFLSTGKTWLTFVVFVTWHWKQLLKPLNELLDWVKVSMVVFANWLVPTTLPDGKLADGAAPPRSR